MVRYKILHTEAKNSIDGKDHFRVLVYKGKDRYGFDFWDSVTKESFPTKQEAEHALKELNSTPTEIRFYVYSGWVREGETVTFEVRDRFEYKTIERKVYYNKHDGLYINYKGKRYYESEFIYN